MVRSRRITSRRRGNGTKARLRYLNQAVQGIAPVVKLPADPPPIKHTKVFTTLVPFMIYAGSETAVTIRQTEQINFITMRSQAKDTAYEVVTITPVLLTHAFSAAMGFDKASDYPEVVIVKASLWGPVPSKCDASVRMCYWDGDTKRVVSDLGTGTNRARVGIHIPLRDWGNTGNAKILEFTIDTCGLYPADKTCLGMLHLTLQGRVKALLS